MSMDSFEQQILLNLQEHMRKYPAMEKQDVMKFVFQAMLGVGHLLSSRENVSKFIAAEMSAQSADPSEPLFEALSPDWCRFSLRRAKAENISPDVIAGMMIASLPALSFTRNDVRALCERWSGENVTERLDETELNAIVDESWLPSHSFQYREKYHPAYRVVSADWISLFEIIRQISSILSDERPLITIDGPCASGKTTLADRLAEVFRAAVVHTDDFVIPHSQKTAERLSVPGGNCDVDRLVREVVVPWKQGHPVEYRKYDCLSDGYSAPAALSSEQALILEGSYSNLPDLREYANLRIFVDAPWDVRKKRLERRESPASLRQFHERWIPLENAYFKAFHLPDSECIIV